VRPDAIEEPAKGVTTGLQAVLGLRMGTLAVEAALEVARGEVVGLLGPNAAGKTTLLRALAGLTSLEHGRVVLDGELLDDVTAGAQVPTEHRSIGVVFQDYRLFPHLSALDNVAFGLRARGTPRDQARRSAEEWLERVGLGRCARARPRALSGGQAQRVALARALATEPRLLLLDEPLAALDAGARAELRHELQRHLAGFAGSCVLVTHDLIEAVTLADRLVVIEDGRITQAGPPGDVSLHPRSRYVADLVGLNLYRGQASGELIALSHGQQLVAINDGHLSGDVFAVVQPRDVALHRTHPEGSPRNVWSGTAEILDAMGERVRVRLSGPVTVVAEVTPAAVAELRLDDGGPVWASVKATEVSVYPA
jgi:molybdate transport system ATP-binding protein